ncbi:hypothetical protein Zm00014a_029245 [Zea mays]|jgi:hypothetical protein|uniref:Uncharacterized protein n=2 Tax=Zea mays TaxID=4577 RepID=K7UZ52_MAIZE|nr:hypothetical protein ZEAMMB73_Zm00001d008825 [Zea mays]PWZ08658.1 hypothetical protein Zm00014a_029245 [Zea mays]
MDGGGYSSISRRGFVRAGFDLDGDDGYYYDDVVVFHPSSFSSSSSSKADGPGAPYHTAGAPRPSARARLRALWRRVMREKKRILLCSTGCVPAPPPPREPYDAYSYAQNFDDGEAWVEPDDHSRSFSARFAVPSRAFQRVAA